MKILFLVLFFLQTLPGRQSALPIYEIKKGLIQFHSNAQLELIKASSDQLAGLIDLEKKLFAFKVPMNSFKGFNSPLQQEHFNENYVESGTYPDATFRGKIIEETDFSKDGEYTVRAKGSFQMHGVPQERIIKGQLSVKKGKIKLIATFTVLLSDHEIKIPRIVSEKLATEVKVDIQAELEEKK